MRRLSVLRTYMALVLSSPYSYLYYKFGYIYSMKRRYQLFLFLFVISILGVCAQKKDKAIILYDQANLELSKKNYQTADSLFTLSLNSGPHPDTYFNRAICRRRLNNFAGYCMDIGGAASYGDKEALGIYYKECIKADTIVTLVESGDTKGSIRSIEIITTSRYSGDKDYERYNSDSVLIASYYKYDNDTIYKSGLDLKYAEFGNSDSLLSTFIQGTKFASWIKTNYSVGKLSFTLIIDEHGKISNIKMIKTLDNEFVKGLINELYGIPNSSPAAISGRKVKFQKNLSVIFAKGLMFVSTSSTEVKGIKSNRPQIPWKNTNNEMMPEFPGGMTEMMKYIQANLKYPQIAKEAGLSGKCYARFVVYKDGSLKNFEILKGVPGCIECDVEALRVISSMPKWKPGIQNGKPVSVFFNLPINFELHR